MFITFCKSEETLLHTTEVKLRFFLNAFVSFIRIIYILTRFGIVVFSFFNRFKLKRDVTTIIEALDIYARISARKHTNNINRTKPFSYTLSSVHMPLKKQSSNSILVNGRNDILPRVKNDGY